MTKIVSIHGGPLPGATGEPSKALIEFLEAELERARSGETIGMAAATLDKDRVGGFAIVGHVGGFSMVGALECVRHRLADVALGQATEKEG